MPNTHDVLPNLSVPSKGTNSTNYITPGTNLSRIETAKNGQLTIVQTNIASFFPPTITTFFGTIFTSGTYNLVTLPHNLPYLPGITAFLFAENSNTSYSQLPASFMVADGSNNGTWFNYWVTTDATNVYLNIDAMSFNAAATVFGGNFIYYLTQQTPT